MSCIVLTATVILSGCTSSGDATLGLAPQTGMGESAHISTTGSTANYESDQTAEPQASVASSYAAPDSDPVPVTVTPEPAETDSEADIHEPQEDDQAGAPAAATSATDTSQSEAAPTDAAAARKSSAGPLARMFSFGKPRPSTEMVLPDTEPPQQNAVSSVQPDASGNAVRNSAGGQELPGVRLQNLFGIGEQDEADLQAPVQVASAAGLARLAPNGLHRQNDAVNTACLKPQLLSLLATVRRHYDRDVLITSGFRSSKHNQRIGGVRASRHTTCEAADIQVPGVNKWELAKYLRTIRGRGGVGTYCHTRSVHIDVGTRRDWNWRCKRR